MNNANTEANVKAEAKRITAVVKVLIDGRAREDILRTLGNVVTTTLLAAADGDAARAGKILDERVVPNILDHLVRRLHATEGSEK